MYLVSKLSTKFADVESKVERICIVTGKASKLSNLVKKKNGFHGMIFNGWTPLQTASFNLHSEVVQYLLPESDPNVTDEMGCTALHLAAWRGSVEITRYLVESATCNILALSQDHLTILHLAVIGGHLPVTEYLTGLRNLKLLNEKSKAGYTALTLACKIGRSNIIQYLVEQCGMDIDTIDSNGSTPLHHSCWEGHTAVISFLVSRGASYEVQNHAGHTPIETCKDFQTRSYLVSCITARLQGDAMPSIASPHRAIQPVTQFPMGNEREEYLRFLAEFRRSLTQFSPVGVGAKGPVLQISIKPSPSSPASLEPPQIQQSNLIFEKETTNISFPKSPLPLALEDSQTTDSLKISQHEMDDEIQHSVDLQTITNPPSPPYPTASKDDSTSPVNPTTLVEDSPTLNPYAAPIEDPTTSINDSALHVDDDSTIMIEDSTTFIDDQIDPLDPTALAGSTAPINDLTPLSVSGSAITFPVATVMVSEVNEDTEIAEASSVEVVPPVEHSKREIEPLEVDDLHQISSESMTSENPSPPSHSFIKRSELPLFSAPSSETLLTLSASSDVDEEGRGSRFKQQSSHGRSFLTMGTRSFSFDFIKDTLDSPRDKDRDQLSSSLNHSSQTNELMKENEEFYSELFHFLSLPLHPPSLTPILSLIDANLSCDHLFPPAPLPTISPLNRFTLDHLFPSPEHLNEENSEFPVRLNKLILSLCTQTGDVDLIKAIQHRFPHCLDPQLRDSNGMTPLHLAIMNQHVDLALYFVRHGNYASVSDSAGNTPLHLATFLEDATFLEAVVESDSGHLLEINAQNSVGQTPLHIAAALGLTSGVRYLVEEVGADPSIVDYRGMNPFNLADGNQHSGIANYLFQLTPPHDNEEDKQESEGEDGAYGRKEEHEEDVEIEEQEEQQENKEKDEEEAEAVEEEEEEVEVEEEEESHNPEGASPESDNLAMTSLEAEEVPSTLFVPQEDEQAKREEGVVPVPFAELSSTKSPHLRKPKWIIPKSKSLDSNGGAVIKVEDVIKSQPQQAQQLQKLDQQPLVEDDLDEFISSFYITHPDYKPPSSNTILSDQNIITGRTPPPATLSTDKEIAVWKFLGRAILEANAMEEDTKQAMRSTFQSLNMNPQVALAFDMKAFTMLGVLTRSYAKKLFHRVAQAFFIWKFLGITIPSFSHPILFAKHGYSLISPPPHSSSLSSSSSAAAAAFPSGHDPSHDPLPQTTAAPSAAALVSPPSSSHINLSNPALVFALKILARYVSRCKHESELFILSIAWNLWTSLPAKPKKPPRKESTSTPTPQLDKKRVKKVITPRSQSLPLPPPVPPQNNQSQNHPSTPQSSILPTNQLNRSLSTVKQKPRHVDSNSNSQLVTPNQPTRRIPKSEGRRPDTSPAMPVEVVEEEDLTALGALPSEITHLFKLNEHVLWDIFSSYVQNRLCLPSNKTEHKKKFAKRLLSMSGIWSLFSDFAICPTLCSKASLKNILDSLLASGQQPTVFYQPHTPPPKIKPSEPIVSMNGFYKILWTIARDCLDAPAASDPTSRLLSLLIRMDGSSGRKKIASNSRASHMVSHFVLNDQAIFKQQQSSLKATDSSSRFISPARAHHSSEGAGAQQRSETTPAAVPTPVTSVSHRSRSVSPKRRPLSASSPPSANKQSAANPSDDSSETMSRTEGSARPPRHQPSISSRIRSQSPKPLASTSPSPRSSPTPQQRNSHAPAHSHQRMAVSSPSPAPSPLSSAIQIDTSEETLALQSLPSTANPQRATVRKSATWSSASAPQEEEGDEEEDSCSTPSTPQQKVLDALAKAPVADRMNAKLAAKQFGALVKQFEADETSRNSSPLPPSRFRERSGSGISVENGSGGIGSGETAPTSPSANSSPFPSRLKRMASFARRTLPSPHEKNYTESVWLQDSEEKETETGSTSVATAIGAETERNSSKFHFPEDTAEIEKKQSALTLWRRASVSAPGTGESGETDMSPAGGGAGGEWSEEGEDAGTGGVEGEAPRSDWSPYTKSRKKRGTITRRR